MNFQRLQHFIIVVEAGSLGKAARQVHLSQPALSKSISKLESELEMRLFDRKAALTLTPVGKEVYGRVRHFVMTGGDLERELGLLRRGELGEIRFGCGPLMAESLLGTAVGRILAAQPRLKVRAKVAAVSELEGLLNNRQLDFLIGDLHQLENPEAFDVIRFPKFPIVWFCREGHPLAGRRKVTREQMLDYPLACPPLPPWAQAWFDEALSAAERPFQLSFECSHYGSLLETVRTTDAISGTTEIAIMPALQQGAVTVLNVAAPKLVSETGAVFLKHRSLSVAAEALIQELKARVDGLVGIPVKRRSE